MVSTDNNSKNGKNFYSLDFLVSWSNKSCVFGTFM